MLSARTSYPRAQFAVKYLVGVVSFRIGEVFLFCFLLQNAAQQQASVSVPSFARHPWPEHERPSAFEEAL
jgi:hypothetical protein